MACHQLGCYGFINKFCFLESLCLFVCLLCPEAYKEHDKEYTRVHIITYGSHVWGHSLTQKHKASIRSFERMALRYFAPIWKTTHTASLEVILNKKPSHLEVVGVGIKTYIQIKDQFQNNFWEGIPLDARANSHLRKFKLITTQIKYEGQPLDDFISDYLNDPFYNWNPPARNALVAVCSNDIDDQNKIDRFRF